MQKNKKIIIVLISLFLILLLTSSGATAFNIGAGSSSSTIYGSSTTSYGFTLFNLNSEAIMGYRFSVVDENGITISKTIDVYRFDLLRHKNSVAVTKTTTLISF
ncbi:MAG TPA: hypothetical protein GXZ23_03285 [Clostridiales bacterium]|nr:hypothetical protein [Clostridiales bacterium]